MKKRPSGCLPMPLIILLFAAGLIGLLRSGYLISVWSFYMVAGIETEAVIEQSEQYQYIVRKPRPTRYVTGYRGTYGFDLDGNEKQSSHFTGKFDSAILVDFSSEPIKAGDSIPVLYSRFDPEVSRPAKELDATHVVIMVIVFIPSLFTLLLSSVFFYFNRHTIKYP